MTSPRDGASFEDRTSHVANAAAEWAGELLYDLHRILPSNVTDLVPAVEATRGTGRATVTHRGIPLLVENKKVLELQLTYLLEARSTDDARLTVNSSSFKLRIVDVRMPLFTLDFARSPNKTVPVSHYNVHAKRDDMVWAMASAGRRHRGKRRRQDLNKGKHPQFGDLHFPTGGARFRPALEDILEFAVVEFGVDVRTGALDVLEERRRAWRQIQLRAAIGDDLATAIDELEAHGFSVNGTFPVPGPRLERTGRY